MPTSKRVITGDPYQVHDYDCRPLGPCPEIRLTNGAILGICLLPADLAEIARQIAARTSTASGER